MMLRERMHRLLNFCSPAAVPTEWKEQLVTVGKSSPTGLKTPSRRWLTAPDKDENY